jgi:hypothetical protein
MLFTVFLSPVFVWCVLRFLWIVPSKHRYENEPTSMRRRLESGGPVR